MSTKFDNQKGYNSKARSPMRAQGCTRLYNSEKKFDSMARWGHQLLEIWQTRLKFEIL